MVVIIIAVVASAALVLPISEIISNEKVRRYFSSSHIKNRTVQSMVLTIEASEKRLREMGDKNVKK
mgnify:FL=1